MKFTFDKLRLSGNAVSKTVYYDGSCNLCLKSIEYIRKYDVHKRIEFVPLQNSVYDSENLNTVLFKEGNTLYKKSDAVFKIIKNLQTPVSWLYIFIFVPAFIRNWIYDVVSKNRHKWFGRCEPCGVK
jgi:predicted DCC family thiol-disulfide oxidoreductase YuxK